MFVCLHYQIHHCMIRITFVTEKLTQIILSSWRYNMGLCVNEMFIISIECVCIPWFKSLKWKLYEYVVNVKYIWNVCKIIESSDCIKRRKCVAINKVLIWIYSVFKLSGNNCMWTKSVDLCEKVRYEVIWCYLIFSVNE